MLRTPFLAILVTVACSSGGSGSVPGGGGTTCAQAKKVSDDCNAKQGDSGVTFNFDVAKCESGGSQAQTAAQCIVNNSSNCDCMLTCALKGSCP